MTLLEWDLFDELNNYLIIKKKKNIYKETSSYIRQRVKFSLWEFRTIILSHLR